MARGIQSKRIADELLVQNEEQGHAGEIAEPIVQLSGEPDLAPDGMVVRSHAEYVEGKSLVDMIKEDQVRRRAHRDRAATAKTRGREAHPFFEGHLDGTCHNATKTQNRREPAPL